jgi:AraC-like DNA-binding protein
MTPIQFQKQIRLHEARTRLVVEPGDVTGVGYAVGYDSPSQLAANTDACSACRPAAMRSHCARLRCCRNDRRESHADSTHSNVVVQQHYGAIVSADMRSLSRVNS